MEANIASDPKPGDITLVNRLARRLLVGRLARLRHGTLTLLEGPQRLTFGQAADGLSVTIRVRDARMYGLIALGGTVNVAEAYLRGYWVCDDITALMRLFVRNIDVTDGMEGGVARLFAGVTRLGHWLRRNTRLGSSKNIREHYDLGNDLFELFLDETMAYSSAVFERPDASLREASVEKLDRICRKLDLQPGEQVIEVGGGWGGFAIHAAGNYGCRVTTTTISPAQHELAVLRVREAGLEDRITVLLKDYRDLEGQYDKLVSIEMIEAVGHEFLEGYFRTCSKLLKDDGAMALQAIVLPGHENGQDGRTVDFIQRYVFPGSSLPSVASISRAVARATDMRMTHLEDITEHYVTTLRHWRERFLSRLDEVRDLGYPERFIRLWEYYLCYSEAGFAERYIGDVQVVLAKPKHQASVLAEPIRIADHQQEEAVQAS